MDEETSITNIVLSKVGDCLGSDCSISALRPEMQIHALLIDSLKMIQIVFEIEVHFGIELPEHALFQVDTLKDLINLVRLATSSSLASRRVAWVGI